MNFQVLDLQENLRVEHRRALHALWEIEQNVSESVSKILQTSLTYHTLAKKSLCDVSLQTALAFTVRSALLT